MRIIISTLLVYHAIIFVFYAAEYLFYGINALSFPSFIYDKVISLIHNCVSSFIAIWVIRNWTLNLIHEKIIFIFLYGIFANIFIYISVALANQFTNSISIEPIEIIFGRIPQGTLYGSMLLLIFLHYKGKKPEEINSNVLDQ